MTNKVVEMKQKKEEKEKTETEKAIIQQAEAMKRTTLISKIKVDKNFHAMYVEYGKLNKKSSKETKFTGFEEMLDEKYFLIQSLKEKVCEILCFPTDWEDEMVITGISFNYDPEYDNALRGMVVTMQKKIEGLNCPLNINTPFIKFSSYIDNYVQYPPEESTWDYEVSETVEEIIGNTYLYICGDTKTVQEKLPI